MQGEGFAIERLTQVGERDATDLAHLYLQLSSGPPANRDDLRRVIENETTALLVARDTSGRIVGTLTLVTIAIPTGLRVWIEDVVVDEGNRGQGLGSALVEAALARASSIGARTVDLTSRPSREAANHLYERLGFVRRNTNVYRRTLED